MATSDSSDRAARREGAVGAGEAIFDLAYAYRFQQPLAALLLYLNTAAALYGRLRAQVVLAGLALFALMQLAYVYDGRFASAEDGVNLLPGDAARRRVGLPRIAAFAAPAILYLLLATRLWPVVLAGFVFVPTYGTSVLALPRVKDVPFAKAFVTAMGFWIVGMLAPVLLEQPLSPRLLIELARSSAPGIGFFLCLTILLDIRDVEGDRIAGMKTLPTELGVPATAALLVLLSSAIGLYGWSTHKIRETFFAVPLILLTIGALKFNDRLYYEGVFAAANLYLAGSLFFR